MYRTVPHQPLYSTRALYIGRAAPTPSLDGLESAQKPLVELYSKSDQQSCMDDRDSTLTVLTSGLLMKPINPLDRDLWLRIQDLEACMSVRAYSDPAYGGALVFVPTDSAQGRSSSHPVLFALLMKRRTGGMPISDCYAFVCPNEETATTLVRATSQAFGNQCGWAEDRPTAVQAGVEAPVPKIVDNECYVDDYKDDCAPEFYEKPSLSGFFYTPRSDLIQKYDIGQGTTRMDRFVECAPAPPPPPPPPPANPPTIMYAAVEPCEFQPQPVLMYPDYNQQQVVFENQPQYLLPTQASAQVQPQMMSKAEIKAQAKAAKAAKRLQQNYSASPAADDQPIYMTSLPQAQPQEVIVTGGGQTGIAYIQEAPISGYGDVGPSQPVLDDGMALYARRLPAQTGGVWVVENDVGDGRPFDGNFILRQSDAYRSGMVGGIGAPSFGAIAVNDQY